MSRRKNVIRFNDEVEIVEPEVVLRWGYTLTKEIVKDTLITDEQKAAIWKLLEGCGSKKCYLGNTDDLSYALKYDYFSEKSFEHILDELAYTKLRHEGFGGKERKLFTIKRESLRGKRGYVVDRKVVKTGEYYPPHSYCSYDGYDDYEPGGLKGEKTHVLIRVCIFTDQEDVCPSINGEDGRGIWFDRVNLKSTPFVVYKRY